MKWWNLPKYHPLRIHHEFTQASAKLRRLKRELAAANAEPSQWQIELEDLYPGVEAILRPSAKQIEKAQAKCKAAFELWQAAGQPNNEGKRTTHRNRKRMTELLKERG